VLIRAETAADTQAIFATQAAAFRRRDGLPPEAIPMEAPLVDALRADPDAWIPDLSLVADDGGEVVGHVICSRAWVGEEARPVLGLGPIGVLPDRQGDGIGSTLMRGAIRAADELGEALIGLLGNPEFYGRFGFVASTEHGITPPDPAWGDLFQVRPLAAHDPAVTGTFRYAAAFG
jgi:putative acetyltransferase